ncbi:SPOSA6832_01762, partial [Sporobolomyces salmonicolor]
MDSQRSGSPSPAGEIMEELAHPIQKSAPPTLKRLQFLDQFLALWIILAMAVGIIIGNFSSAEEVLERVQFVNVSLPLAIALIVMMWPILCRVSPASLASLFRQRGLWKHLLASFVVNWIIAPMFMFALAWAFLPDKQDLREGLILVGLARCIAMVLVWTDIAGGDLDLNSLLQIVLYSPFAIFYIRVLSDPDNKNDIEVDYPTVAKSVAVFLGIPLAAALVTRGLFILLRAQKFFQNRFLPAIAPLSLIALLFTIIVIFAAQGKQVVKSITDVLRVVPPLLVYFFAMFFAAFFTCRRARVSYPRTVVHSVTSNSNNFEVNLVLSCSQGMEEPQADSGRPQPRSSRLPSPWPATAPILLKRWQRPVPVLLGLSYGLVWYRRRSKWDLPTEGDDQSVGGSVGGDERGNATGSRPDKEDMDKSNTGPEAV